VDELVETVNVDKPRLGELNVHPPSHRPRYRK
jgi:hypothetical protein